MHIVIETQIDDELTAVIVAVFELLQTEQLLAADPEPRSAWSTAGILANQGLPGARGPLAWSAADRMGRAARWSQGVLGLFHEW